MKLTTPARYENSLIQQETLTSSHIPFSYLLDDETVETKSGHLLQTIQVIGLYAETLDDQVIDQEKQRIQYLLNSLVDSSTSLYFHTVRKPVHTGMQADYDEPFAQQLHDKWQSVLASKTFFSNSHYITVVKKPPRGKVRGVAAFAKSLLNRVDQRARKKYRAKTHQDINAITHRILTNLIDYQASKLSTSICRKTQQPYSNLLAFLSYLINLEESNVIAPRMDLASYLPFKRLFFDKTSGTLALRHHQAAQYAAILAIKDYPGKSCAGLLNHLLDIPANLIITQSFSFLEKTLARKIIHEQQRNQLQSDDGETSDQINIDRTLDDLGTNAAAAGEHCLSVLCHAASSVLLEDHVAKLNAALNDIGAIGIREDAGIKSAFFSILPGNHPYLIRKALITTKHMAGFASLHNYDSGRRHGNHWGEAITFLETISGTPFAFNFHVSDVANTFLIGPMGSGKTLLEAFLLTLSMKHGGRLIVFDKDRGLEPTVRALNGFYTQLKAGTRTGMAPFQMDDTQENRYALTHLMKMIATINHPTITDEEEMAINNAIHGAYQLPKAQRIFRHIVPFLGMRQQGSLRMRFENWINAGDYAWVFDNEIDELNLDQLILGFDLTSILDDLVARAPTYYYLFHCIEQRLDGMPTRIVGAEAWRALEDPEFLKKIKDWSSTPRKKNAFLVLDTQAPNDIAQSPIGCKIIQESVTQIYFANLNARREDYVEHFGLSEKEYEIVKTLDKEAHFFLLKQGKRSVVVRADLSLLTDEIILLSNRNAYHPYLESALKEVGNDPQKWIPLYLRKIKSLTQGLSS